MPENTPDSTPEMAPTQGDHPVTPPSPAVASGASYPPPAGPPVAVPPPGVTPAAVAQNTVSPPGQWAPPTGPPQWISPPVPRRNGVLRVIGMIVVALVLLGGAAYAKFGWKPSSGSDKESFYMGTEAQFWKAAADIDLAGFGAQPHFTEERVRKIMDDIENLLVLTRDDWANGKADPAALMAAYAPALKDPLTKALDTPDRLGFVSALAEGHKLLEEVRYSPGPPNTAEEKKTEDGVTVLEITVNSRFSYYFDRKGQRYFDPLVILVSTSVWQVPADGEVDRAGDGLWLSDYDWNLMNGDCEEALDGFIAPGRLGGKQAVTDDKGEFAGCE